MARGIKVKFARLGFLFAHICLIFSMWPKVHKKNAALIFFVGLEVILVRIPWIQTGLFPNRYCRFTTS